ncbi:hypothetical protein DEIPH_ctg103orf0035 [Deinococcus phoenicis]|uniref:Leucine rich repeat variant domain-containing protein n=1 Tax=Deinococcus phoenicis TaxID=1476583 RepID=A0A016QKD6_9DEIO|nr:hypothetical protein [Deinococcus phoenicis]EYB66508.1 hypothetical protein DEIPH_ctg103orf0035 [Deinococcus phoenicis]
MGKLTPMQEATHDSTSEVRLLALATASDASVRRAAQAHPRLGKTFRNLLIMAEEYPERLSPHDLAWLSRQGPFGQQIAAAHAETPGEALKRLVMAGQTRAVLRVKNGRDGQWLLALARQDSALLAYLSRDYSVPWNLRRQAYQLHHARGAATAQLTAAPANPTGEAALLVPHLREKLRNRREPPTFTDEEADLLRTNPALQRLAAHHPLLPVPLLEWLDRLHPHGQARETLLYRLEHHDLEAELFARLAREGDWEARAALARNAHLPGFLLPSLADDQDWWVRASVAENPNTVPEHLAVLAREDDHAVIRENVARHPHTPGETLADLAGDGEAAVRLQAARNPSTPPEALARLAGDDRYATREAVAAHPLTPPEVVRALSGDANERVALVARLRLSHVTEQGLGELLATRRRNVKLAVASRAEVPLPLLRELARDRSPQVRAQVSMHPWLPEFERGLLRQDADPTVGRVALAADPAAPPEVLLALPRHDARIRQGLSRNAATPAPVLDSLSDDALEDVRLAVVLNPASPEGALQRRLPEQPLRPGIRRHPLYDHVKPNLHRLEYQEASNPATSPEALEALADSDAPRVRQQVALHPATSTGVLLRLAQDEWEEVRRALAGREALAAEVQHALALDAALTVKERLVGREDLPPQIMLLLAQQVNGEEALLLSLTRHPAVTGEVLAALARQPGVAVREEVARHARTPLAAQIHLAADPQDTVAGSVLKNPTCGPEVLAVLARQSRFRLRVAQHPRTAPQTLEALAFDAPYARLLHLERLLRRAPPALREQAQVRRWVKWLRQRASGNAFRELNVLAAVIRHPAATGRTVQFASRLNHTEIAAARQERQARLRPPSSPDPEAPHE